MIKILFLLFSNITHSLTLPEFIKASIKNNLNYRQLVLSNDINKMSISLRRISFYTPDINLIQNSSYKKTVSQHNYGRGPKEPHLQPPDPSKKTEILEHTLNLEIANINLFNSWLDKTSLSVSELSYLTQSMSNKVGFINYLKELVLFYYQTQLLIQKISYFKDQLNIINSLKESLSVRSSNNSNNQGDQYLTELEAGETLQQLHDLQTELLLQKRLFNNYSGLDLDRVTLDQRLAFKKINSKDKAKIKEIHLYPDYQSALNGLKIAGLNTRSLWIKNLPKLTLTMDGAVFGRGYTKDKDEDGQFYYNDRFGTPKENTDLKLSFGGNFPLLGKASGPFNYLDFVQNELSYLSALKSMIDQKYSLQAQAAQFNERIEQLEKEYQLFQKTLENSNSGLSQIVDAYLARKINIVTCLETLIRTQEANVKVQEILIENVQNKFDLAALTGDLGFLVNEIDQEQLRSFVPSEF